jgi:hypothetical protein
MKYLMTHFVTDVLIQWQNEVSLTHLPWGLVRCYYTHHDWEANALPCPNGHKIMAMKGRNAKFYSLCAETVNWIDNHAL